MIRRAVLVVLFGAALGGCALLPGYRPAVDVAEAQSLLERAFGIVAADRLEALCDLAPPEGSTCHDTLEVATPVVPHTPPRIRCSARLPDFGPLRFGTVLVVEGTDDLGEPYASEFYAYHDGDAVRVLDPVYWAGLRVRSYTAESVTWAFDGTTDLCETGSLPGEGGGDPVPLGG
ncbi:MAG: hypothetical protein KY434_08015 [Actinobacteria bacterium]|nr:hypothetical protein [Actinomycetota bacterium]